MDDSLARPHRILDMAHAAKVMGMSVRHFHRAYREQYRGKVFQINRKFFVLAADVAEWKAMRASS